MPTIGHQVTCKTCGKSTYVMEGENVHDALDCQCCPTSTHTHAGENGETVKEPCRDVIVSANAVVFLTQGEG